MQKGPPGIASYGHIFWVRHHVHRVIWWIYPGVTLSPQSTLIDLKFQVKVLANHMALLWSKAWNLHELRAVQILPRCWGHLRWGIFLPPYRSSAHQDIHTTRGTSHSLGIILLPNLCNSMFSLHKRQMDKLHKGPQKPCTLHGVVSNKTRWT